ncbi:MAG: hypothetical protein NTV97_10265 [Alphaproteobacteria bacterium]|nr:hypothetical protein [Alphaproteobacteria bacterium]
MFLEIEQTAKAEPPSTAAIDDGSCAARVDRIMAMTHLPATAHVALIGHHTLPSLLAFLRHGCGAVRCLRPDAPSPDCERTYLAWIVDVQSDRELDDALRAARLRVGKTGRIVVEGGCLDCADLNAIYARAVACGLEIVSFDHTANRAVLAAQSPLAMAA